MTSATPSRLKQLWLKPLLKLAQKSWWMSLLVWLAAIAPAHAALELRVAIEQDVSRVTLGSSTPATVRDASGQVLAQLPAGGAVTAQAASGAIQVNQFQTGQVWVEPSNGGFVFIGDRWYRGRTMVVPTGGGLTAVNYVDLEQYLYSVVGGEMPTNWPLEALKAQAVTARSYALYQRQTSANAVFDVGDTTAWQVYRGVEEETNTTQAAVQQTEGQVLTYNGQIIEAVFHSSSGGHTENVEDVWTQALPYLRAVQDFDQGAPVYQWNETIPADRLRQVIPGIGNILSMVPDRTTPRGRIVTMRVTGEGGTRIVSGAELRRSLQLRSTLFSVTPILGQVASAGNVPSIPTGFLITGRGFGHGLGMSQWGAYNLASQGYNYQQIVTHYYTGATLAKIQVE
ncbi:SpoIID/LytB domain-containing protein [Oscillatoria sp. FACHB-1407]|uniref:SpoIID/LytB domain-containing protein n=1 Tax=Oscillatoria sp. FACHB-1407 TaxID=2692847 RepID=UPI0016854355|nr:SpoIID/LytB domain-containing protein [Oscillatoria sp. FACHB-1407]MBD2464841.1 SpoIID/LytB domain-containing protein [Oscillatoria sp. FACHB-1407]